MKRIFWKLKYYKNVLFGYIKPNGEPIKCFKCKCKKLEKYNSFTNSAGFTEEFSVCCSKCKEHLGVWAYGGWFE